MRYAKKKFTCLCMMLAAGMSWQDIAQATENDLMNADSGPPMDDPPYLAHDWLPVSGAQLDELRGGFDTGSGLKISFGIRREVYMNDNLVASANLNITDVHGATGEQAWAIPPVPALQLIQNGPGNYFDSGAIPQSAAAIVIQNTLNQQDIRGLTVINATANSLELLKDLNMQSALAEAIGQSAGAR